jgi:hypothetical protein
MSSSPDPKKSTAKKRLKFTLRWGIAVFGIWYVVSNMSLHDRVLFLNPSDVPVAAKLARPAPPLEEITRNTTFYVIDPLSKQVVEMKRPQLVNRADQKHVTLRQKLAARRAARARSHRRYAQPARPPATDQGFRNRQGRMDQPEGYGARIRAQRAVPDRGPGHRADGASAPTLHTSGRRSSFSPIVYVITAYRWHALLAAVGIMLPLARTFVLNMVGAFYNTFMPGSTGGDLLKAYYASKQTPHKMRAVMTVIIDRILGLLALVLMGGTMAAYEYFALDRGEPARPWCGRVAFGSLIILIGTLLAGKIAFQPMLRRALGLEYLLARLPAQRHLVHAIETMRIYRQRKSLLLWAVLITLPVHATVVVSALFAGKAFNLPMHSLVLLGRRAGRRSKRCDPYFAAGRGRDGILRDPADAPRGRHDQRRVRAHDVDPRRADPVEPDRRNLRPARRLSRAHRTGSQIDGRGRQCRRERCAARGPQRVSNQLPARCFAELIES